MNHSIGPLLLHAGILAIQNVVSSLGDYPLCQSDEVCGINASSYQMLLRNPAR